MTTRQKAILGAIVREYTETAEPVGSKVLVEKYFFKLSPATIRNEMKVLEDEKFIEQPHTSAGRVPTSRGYRLFVDTMINYVDLAKREQVKLENKLKHIRLSYDKVLKEAASMMAQISGNVALTEKDQEHAFCSGIANLLQLPEFADVEKACKLAEVFERLSEAIPEIDDETKSRRAGEVAVYIGPETKLTKELDCSLVVSDYQLPSGERGHIAIMGPTRMKYDKNISLVRYLAKLLGSTFFPVLIIILLTGTNFCDHG